MLKFFYTMSASTGYFAFGTGGIAYNSAQFGAGTGPIYLDDVSCTSSANQLLECSSRPILAHNCAHSTDAGVGCKGNILYFEFSYIRVVVTK